MSVYIDAAFIPASVSNGSRTHTSQWCHLMADTTEELVAFATSIGLRRSWIQYEGTPKEHFDLTTGKRWQAVRAGAIEIDSEEAVSLMQAKRASRAATRAESPPGASPHPSATEFDDLSESESGF